MATTSGFAALPLYRKLALGAAVLLFIDLFLSWFTSSLTVPGVIDDSASASGWNGIGVLAGILAALLIAWEVGRLLGMIPQISVSHDLVTAGLAGLTALFTIIQFIRALTFGGDGDGAGIEAGAGYAAWIGLILALALGYAAYLAFTAGGGREAINQAQGPRGTAAPTADRPVVDDRPTDRPAADHRETRPVADDPLDEPRDEPRDLPLGEQPPRQPRPDDPPRL